MLERIELEFKTKGWRWICGEECEKQWGNDTEESYKYENIYIEQNIDSIKR